MIASRPRVLLVLASASLLAVFVGMLDETHEPDVSPAVDMVEIDACPPCVLEILPDRSTRFVTEACIDRHRRNVDRRRAQPLSVFDLPDTSDIDRCWERPRNDFEDIVLADTQRVEFAIHVGLDGSVTHASASSALSPFTTCSERAITRWRIDVPPGIYKFDWSTPETR